MQKAVVLSNGVSMPLIGFGTYKIHGRELIFSVVKTALEVGYRSFDTAAVYRNEKDLGEALCYYLPKLGLSRKDLFITSKLSPRDQGSKESLAALERSLTNLQLDYLDLFLIHWPAASRFKPEDPKNREVRHASWKGLEEAYKSGLVKAIGVSNYTVDHIKDLLLHASIIPHVNQVEYHPYYLQKELKSFCGGQGIHLQAYSSLGSSVQPSPLLQDPTVTSLATHYSCSPAQLLLCWATQQGVGVLPKSTNEDHIRENIELDCDLSEGDLHTLSSLGINQKYAWDPSVVL